MTIQLIVNNVQTALLNDVDVQIISQPSSTCFAHTNPCLHKPSSVMDVGLTLLVRLEATVRFEHVSNELEKRDIERILLENMARKKYDT